MVIVSNFEHSLNMNLNLEPTTFDYSTKNIPIPNRKDYIKQLIDKAEQFCKRMRWKAFFHLNPECKPDHKETYGFKSRRAPPSIPQLTNFEKGLTNIIKNIKFKRKRSNFQQQLNSDIKSKIKNNDKILVPADKTNNYYKLSANEYHHLTKGSVTKNYKKVDPSSVATIAREDKAIAQQLQLDDRIMATSEKEAFITLKDHKPNFRSHPSCRLINPRKTEIG